MGRGMGLRTITSRLITRGHGFLWLLTTNVTSVELKHVSSREV